MSIVSLLFSPKGRIRRRDYWVAGVSVIIASSLVKLLGLIFAFGVDLSAVAAAMGRWRSLKADPVTFYLWAVTLVFIWPGLCLAIKRWHDRNRPGWFACTIPIQYILSFAQLYYAPLGFNESGGNRAVYIAILLISLVLMVWVFVELGCLDGTKGPNKYGPSPKGIGAGPDVF